MAIQPIDLQTLFTQVDKVGKNQSMLKDGQHIQEALKQLKSQQKLEENVRAVNETQNMGEETAKIKKDDTGHGHRESHTEKKKDGEDEDEFAFENKKQALIRDPALGRNIDISG